MKMKALDIKRGMVQTTLGSIFYLMSDGRTSTTIDKPPVLCFHMSPRSSDEFLEVLPLLASGGSNDDEANGRAVIAFDLPGYGASENPPHSCTVDEISDACVKAADSILGVGSGDTSYVTVGSLLGNYFCVSLASRYPERIKGVILTNPWFNPGATGMVKTATENNTPIPDSFTLKDDGSHLVELHSKRSKWLDPEMNLRVVQSELSYLANRRKRYPKGINIESGNDYDFSTAIQNIVEERSKRSSSTSTSFLCIRGDACATMFDRFGLEGTKRFDEACSLLTGDDVDETSGACRVETLQGGKSTLNVVNQMPEEFAALCNQFLSDIS